MVLADNSVDVPPPVRFNASAVLRGIHGFALKWRPHDGVVLWGEGAILGPSSLGRFSLLSNDSAPSLSKARGGEHRTRVHPYSPNALYVWRSQLPPLFSKSNCYSWWRDDVCTSLWFLVWNLVLKGYPLGWW